MDEIDELLKEILVTHDSDNTDPATGFTPEESAFLHRILATVPEGSQCVFAALEKDGTLSFLTTGSTTAGSVNVLALLIHRLVAKKELE